MMYVYYCIEKYMLFLQNYLGIIMIALIVLALLLNNFLDYILKQVKKGKLTTSYVDREVETRRK